MHIGTPTHCMPSVKGKWECKKGHDQNSKHGGKTKKGEVRGRTPTWVVDLARFLFVVRVTFLRMAGMDSMT